MNRPRTSLACTALGLGLMPLGLAIALHEPWVLVSPWPARLSCLLVAPLTFVLRGSRWFYQGQTDR